MAANLRGAYTRPATEMRRVGHKSSADDGCDSLKNLTPEQVDAPVGAAKDNRHGLRDALIISLAYHHGVRATDLVDPRWSPVDGDHARLHVRRVKNGIPSVHTLKAMRSEHSAG